MIRSRHPRLQITRYGRRRGQKSLVAATVQADRAPPCTCAVNTWGVVFAGGPAKRERSYVILPGSGHFLYLNSNHGAGRFNVCG